MLTNRHHHTRWSLEQNQEIIEGVILQRAFYKRRWFQNLLGATIISCTIFLLLRVAFIIFDRQTVLISNLDDTSAIIVNDHREQEAHGVLLPVEAPILTFLNPTSHNYAYVTLLCDNSGLPNARVLAYALKRSKTQYPFIIMSLPFVTEGLEDLITLGATIEKIPIIPTPFKKANGKRPSFRKLCKYSKIHAWSMTKFSKMIYLDANLLVVSVYQSDHSLDLLEY